MPRGKLQLAIPAASEQAFEAFFNHQVRLRWDTLLSINHVEGGGTHPYVGAVTVNRGRGWRGGYTLRTRFLTYDPPRRAGAEMIEPSGPFHLWAASLVLRDTPQGCDLIYTYSIRMRPRLLAWLIEPVANHLFARETRRRFLAMAAYLRTHQGAVPAAAKA
jgi:hypothetical protein